MNSTLVDPVYNAIFEKMIANSQRTMREEIRRTLDGRRDIDAECGNIIEPSLEDYQNLYDRESVAARVVELYPSESWKTQPIISEDQDPDSETEFDKNWKELGKSLGSEGFFESQEGNPIWGHLYNADVKSGIGSFGLLLIGLSDGKPLNEEPVKSKDLKVLFLREFSESFASVKQRDIDTESPRFNEPISYEIEFDGGKSQEVHWMRVIHLQDNNSVPRQQQVLNQITNIRKISSASPEGYWKSSSPILAFSTHPQMGGDVVIDKADMRNQMENLQNSLQHYLSLRGMSASSLAPEVVDPTPHIDAQIQLICIQKNCPKRIFMGSERGELSSSQDSRAWNITIGARQQRYVTPKIIVPFVDRLILLGVLPEPKQYFVDWPDLDTLTDLEQADVALKVTQALAAYVQGDVAAIVDLIDYLVEVLGMESSRAKAIIDNVIDRSDDDRLPEKPEEPEAPQFSNIPPPSKLE